MAAFTRQMLRVENSLTDLNKEIVTATANLKQLQDDSVDVVRKLRCVTSPPAFIKQFIDVNSFLLKYLGFLTELNCKFELLRVPDNQNCESVTQRFNVDEFDSHFESDKCISPIDDCVISSKVTSGSQTSLASISSCTEASGGIKSLNAESNESTEKSVDDRVVESESTKGGLRSDTGHKITKEYSEGAEVVTTEQEEIGEWKTDPQSLGASTNILNHSNSKESGEQQPPTKHNGTQTMMNGDNSGSETGNSSKSEVNPMIKGESLAAPKVKSRIVGEEFEVVLEHIRSPAEFYVHYCAELDSFRELERKLAAIPANSERVWRRAQDLKVHPDKGTVPNALYYSKCDEIWCRVVVKDCDTNFRNDLVQIFLVDYGEVKCVTVNDLLPIPEVFKHPPPFARRCHLYGILPVTNSKSSAWERESTDKMISLTESSATFRVTVAPRDQHHSVESLPVILWLAEKGNGCVNELLVNFRCAVQDKDAVCGSFGQLYQEIRYSCIIEKTSLEDWNPMKQDFESHKNTYQLNVNDPAAAIYSYVGKDYERICIHFAKTGKCYKGKACRKEHTRLDPKGFTTDKEEVYRNAFNIVSTIPTRSNHNIQITCILELSRFCCIIDDPAWCADDENLATLVAYMNKPENVRDMEKLLVPPSTGQVVLAQYTEDDSWYRARVLESQPENDSYGVVFVDYGNREQLPLSRIRAVEPRYLHLPFQAIQCRIFGIAPNPKISPREGIKYFNTVASQRKMTIQVVAKLPGDEVSLQVNLFDENGKNIGAELVAHDFAVYKQEIIISEESDVVPG